MGVGDALVIPEMGNVVQLVHMTELTTHGTTLGRGSSCSGCTERVAGEERRVHEHVQNTLVSLSATKWVLT